MPSLRRRLRSWLHLLARGWRRTAPARPPFAALLGFHAAYRAVLWWRFAHTESPPFSFILEREGAWSCLGTGLYDVLLSAVLAVLLGLLAAWAARGKGRLLGLLSGLVHLAVLLLVGTASAIHADLVFAMNAGLDVEALTEAGGTLAPAELLAYGSLTDLALVLAGPLLWLVLARLPPLAAIVRDAIAGGWTMLALIAFLVSDDAAPPRREVAHTPLLFTVESLWESTRTPAWAALEPPVSEAQRGTLRLVDPRFLLPGRRPAEPLATAPPDPGGDRPNVLFVIGEGVGRPYVFDVSRGNAIPMPVLRQLADTGWILENHHANANTSPRCLFALFSGLYSEQDTTLFCASADVVIPSLATFLGPAYDRFLFTPGRLKSYFPLGFLRASGLTEVRGFEDLSAEGVPRKSRNGLDERRVVDAFLARLERAPEPFLAVYYSYVPHWPYRDYGPEWRIIPVKGKRLHRYYNNLRLLDAQIGRMLEALEARGLRERTLVVFVGDHGEAFDQHPGNRTHSRESYEENLHAAAVLHFPARLPPYRVAEVTTHVDLLPTILDTLGLPWDPDRLQGESLFSPSFARRYVFAVGNERTNTALSQEGIKVQISYKSDSCRAFDLDDDPDETTPLDCGPFTLQRDALLAFKRFQTEALHAYNEALLGGTPWTGLPPLDATGP